MHIRDTCNRNLTCGVLVLISLLQFCGMRYQERLGQLRVVHVPVCRVFLNVLQVYVVAINCISLFVDVLSATQQLKEK